MRLHWIVTVIALTGSLVATLAHAEPYLAVRMGAKCMTCHVNPTGGGKRTEYGTIYGYTALPEGRLEAPSGAAAPGPWTGKINDYFAVGADARMNLESTHAPNREDTLAFRVQGAQLYADFQIVPNRLSFYVDERIAPGIALSRETYALLWSQNKSAYVKAGRFFLPYGLRLEDDSAFIRQASGINFNSSDEGIEGGLELGPWSTALAVSNGNAGIAENNTGKQYSLLASFVQPVWRLGTSFNLNKNDGADRKMQNVFAGLRTGIVSWLGEADYITNEGTPTGVRKQRAGLLEANVEVLKGHNLKLTYEQLDPDLDVAEDQRKRYSLVWEYVPFQYTQFRLGYRDNKGPPQIDSQNAKEMFIQWHAFF
jgi:hypothetical protein